MSVRRHDRDSTESSRETPGLQQRAAVPWPGDGSRPRGPIVTAAIQVPATTVATPPPTGYCYVTRNSASAGSWVAIAQWAATAPQALGVCGAPPPASTFPRVLATVDITAVEAALSRWVIGRQARCRRQRRAGTTAAEARSVLAVNGTTLRGSRDGTGQQTELSASMTTPTSWCSPRRW